MASSPFERLLTAGLKASNESRRQVEAALIRLVDAQPTAQHVENSDQVSELVEREVAREVGLRTDELVDRLDELETRLAETALPAHRKDDKGEKKQQHGKANHGKKKPGKKKDRKKKDRKQQHGKANHGGTKPDKSTSTRKAKRSATAKRAGTTERTASKNRAATTKRVGATEPAARDAEPVGASGVRRGATTRSSRNEG